MLHLLQKIRIILVEPTHPGNIGAVARSMKTMGLSDLVLIKPKKFPHCEANKRAAGAESVLQTAQVVGQLDQAVADCTMVLGTSVRDREVSWPILDPRMTADKVINHLMLEPKERTSPFERSLLNSLREHQVAILFGRESSGLTNTELDLCEAQIRIDANVEYSSLNLASAVQIIAYEMRVRCLEHQLDKTSVAVESMSAFEKRQQLATQQQREGHIEHLQKTLEALDFIKTKPPTLLMRKLTRLYNKADLSVEEIQILRGILSAMQSKLDTK